MARALLSTLPKRWTGVCGGRGNVEPGALRRALSISGKTLVGMELHAGEVARGLL